MIPKGATSLRIAVLIPAWNEKSYILEALESVALQTRHPDELIVVDDGSSDSTRTIVREWSDTHGMNVELMRQERSGVASARNHEKGSEKGSGLFVNKYVHSIPIGPSYSNESSRSTWPPVRMKGGQSIVESLAWSFLLLNHSLGLPGWVSLRRVYLDGQKV